MTMTPREDLERELQDPEFAAYYGADQAKVQLALTLVDARDTLGLTQKEVANKLGASQPYVAKLEKGDANPTIGKIGSMLALLGLRLVTQTEPLLPEPISPGTIYAQLTSSRRFVGTAAGITLEGAWLLPAERGVLSATAVPADDFFWTEAVSRRPDLIPAGGTVQ